MGPLSEFIRKKKSSRSLHPYWSIVGIGKKRKLLDKQKKGKARDLISPKFLILLN